MQVEYQNTIDDVIAFNRYHTANSPRAKRTRMSLLFGLPLVFLFPGLLVAIHAKAYEIAAWSLVFPVVLFVVMLTRKPDARDKAVRQIYQEGRNKSLSLPWTLDVQESGILNASEISEHRYRWAAIEKVATDEGHLFIYTGSINAIVVPRSTAIGAVWEELLGFARLQARKNGIPVVGTHWPAEVTPPPLPG